MHQFARIVVKLFQGDFFSLLCSNAVKKAAIIMIPIPKANSSAASSSSSPLGLSRTKWNAGGLDGFAAHLAALELDINSKPGEEGEGGHGRVLTAMRYLIWDKNIFLEQWLDSFSG